MTENFEHSGWKEKKLWAPPVDEKEDRSGAGPRSRLRADASAPAVSQGISRMLGHGDKKAPEGSSAPAAGQAGEGAGGSEPALGSRPPRAPKAQKGPLEALDPDSETESDSGESEGRPEYAVLDMNVPRTALVINVSHVLKRLNGCCSLNQLTKAIKNFKENTGMTLEAFLRAHPNNFQLEGRIVFLVDRDGNRWMPPKGAKNDHELGGKGKGKGKVKGEPTSGKGEPAKGKGDAGKGDSGKGKAQKGESAKGKGDKGKSSSKGKGKQDDWHSSGGEGKKRRSKREDEWEAAWWHESWDEPWWDSGWSHGGWGKGGDWHW